MTPSTNRIEAKCELSDDLEQEAVAFLNSGGGDIEIMKLQTFSCEAAKPRSSDTTFNLKTETDRIMKTAFQHLIPDLLSSRLRVSLSNSHQSISQPRNQP